MNNLKVTVIDYGMGNLWSVLSALRYLGANPITSGDPDQIVKANALLLPGVGSFRKAMTSLKNDGLDQAIIEAVKNKGTRIFGICLGMQLMGLSSTEGGDTEGLGLIPANVERFALDEVGMNKIPHIGFDRVETEADWNLFNGLQDGANFYFVHSYRMLGDSLSGKRGICSYGVDFLAAYEENNIFATQFHPEKSQVNGLILLKNYLSQLSLC